MERPLILVCNDDGIGSPFLPNVVKRISEIGETIVVVPATEQSWIGRAHNRHGEVEVREVEPIFGARSFTISGTPSDCVNIGISHICPRRPDVAFSGINIGHNLGFPLLWSSGTFSAAVEAAGFGVASAAFSLRISKEFYEACRMRHAAVPSALAPILDAASINAANFLKTKLLCDNSSPILKDGKIRVYNVNYPERFSLETPVKETEATRVSLVPLFKKQENGNFRFSYSVGEMSPTNGKIGDWECLSSGCASVSEIEV